MPLASLIRERRHKDREQGITRKRADRRHFHTTWMRSQPGRVYYSPAGGVVTLAEKRVKYVDRHSAYFPYTAGELARIYLDRLMASQGVKLGQRFSFTEREKALLEIPAPLYFDPERGREGRFVYIDIAAAYFQLFAELPLNLAYNPQTDKIGRPRPALQIPASDLAWLEREKPLRHALFGVMSSTGVSWFQDGQPKSNTFRPAYSAPDLHALVKTRLHKIARKAVEDFGCRMWLTDAGIFTERDGLCFQLWLASTSHLSSKPKAWGNGVLWALGDYRVGRLTSQMQHVELGGFSNL